MQLAYQTVQCPLHAQDVSVADVVKAIEEASVSTIDRCAGLQTDLE